MDDFGTLARDFGFRPQGKSSPMKSDGNRPPPSSATVTEENRVFGNVFGGPPKHTNNSKSSSAMPDLDYDAIFKNAASTNNDEVKSKITSAKLPVYDDDIFDGLPGLKSKSMSASMSTSPSKRNQQSDNFDDVTKNPSRPQKVEHIKQNRSKSPSGFDDLLPGFGSGRAPTSNRSSEVLFAGIENVQVADDIWLTVSEIPLFTKPTRSPPPSKPPPPIPTHLSKPERGSLPSSSRKVEEMDSVLANAAMKEAMDRAEAKFRHAKEVREREKAFRNKELFEERERAIKEARERAAIEARLKNERAAVQRAQSEARERAAVRADRAATEAQEKDKAANMRKSSSVFIDDLSSIFGGGQFQEVEGETEERRKARIEREQRTQERTAKALAEKNQRDLQSQREQEERNRIGGSLDTEIKRWASGKEGNLRALLSTLQYVLWPESGWQAVSLTDLISGVNVKKAYRKATLCIHPDKVQQKGATLQQKYVAEKVFDILKEAWNKFNSEELF